ncbi:hypothetical protein JTE90_024366 [Oedothorax gibbosus]|uniref:Uncharacterized protein n=1 Tax=Oedothorax gibbosus TaxID=931172 RepID=A0AAV6VXZ0_9ARAC|nr:hypothetical protein JTE90_024366 [Oedothorax gibbosus]
MPLYSGSATLIRPAKLSSPSIHLDMPTRILLYYGKENISIRIRRYVSQMLILRQTPDTPRVALTRLYTGSRLRWILSADVIRPALYSSIRLPITVNELLDLV